MNNYVVSLSIWAFVAVVVAIILIYSRKFRSPERLDWLFISYFSLTWPLGVISAIHLYFLIMVDEYETNKTEDNSND